MCILVPLALGGWERAVVHIVSCSIFEAGDFIKCMVPLEANGLYGFLKTVYLVPDNVDVRSPLRRSMMLQNTC